MRTTYAVVAALLLLGAAACFSDDADPVRSTGSPSKSSSSPNPPTSAGPTGGTSDEPVVLEPGDGLLDWAPVAGSTTQRVTRGGAWTLTVGRSGAEAVLDGPQPITIPATGRSRISDALLDGDYAVVVSQDSLEERPSTATVITLATGKRFVLNGRSDLPTSTGGSWALGGGRVQYATYGEAGVYCLASVDIEKQFSDIAWCAPERHGFSQARISPAGNTLLTFDDSRPSCRTVLSLTGGEGIPFPDVPACKAWDGALVGEGRIWSVVPKENRIEQAHFYAVTGDRYVDLGAGTSGSLVTCGDSAYFTRDPQHDSDPAQLLRWTAAGEFAVAYETKPSGGAFIATPLRCGGDRLTLTSLTESGDEQVSAAVD